MSGIIPSLDNPFGFLVWVVAVLFAFRTLWSIEVQRQRLPEEENSFRAVLERVRDGGWDSGKGFTEADLTAFGTRTLAARVASSFNRARLLQNADVDSLLAPVEAEAAARLSPYRGAANALMLLGLLVTLFGLASTLGGVFRDVDFEGGLTAEKISTLGDTLKRSLSAMQLAFAGSLWGVALALLVSAYLTWVTRQYQTFLVRLSRSAHEIIAPFVFPPRVEVMVESLQAAISESRVFFGETRDQMVAASQAFQEVLTSSATVLRDNLVQLEQSASSIRETLLQVSQHVADGTKQLASSARKLGSYHDELRNSHTDMRNLFETSRDDLDRRSTEFLGQMNELQKEFGSAATTILSGVTDTSGKLDATRASIDAAALRIDDSGTRVATSAEQSFTKLHSMLKKTLSEHEREMSNVGEAIKAVAEQFNRSIDLTLRLEKLSGEVEQREAARHANLVALLERIADGQADASEALQKDLEAARGEQRAIAAALQDRYGVQLGESEARSLARLSEISSEQERRFASLQTVLREGFDGIAQSLARRLSELEGERASLVAVLDQKLAALSVGVEERLVEHAHWVEARLEEERSSSVVAPQVVPEMVADD